MQAARLPLQRKIGDCGSRLVRPRTAERERADSAAKSIQRMKPHRAAPCRGTTASARLVNGLQTYIPGNKDRQRKNWCRRAPNFSFLREQPPAALCSIALARVAVFALSAWNETDKRLAPGRLFSPGQRTRNGSRSRTMNRSQSRQLRLGRLHS
jgi:hypothetical protein